MLPEHNGSIKFRFAQHHMGKNIPRIEWLICFFPQKSWGVKRFSTLSGGGGFRTGQSLCLIRHWQQILGTD